MRRTRLDRNPVARQHSKFRRSLSLTLAASFCDGRQAIPRSPQARKKPECKANARLTMHSQDRLVGCQASNAKRCLPCCPLMRIIVLTECTQTDAAKVGATRRGRIQH